MIVNVPERCGGPSSSSVRLCTSIMSCFVATRQEESLDCCL